MRCSVHVPKPNFGLFSEFENVRKSAWGQSKKTHMIQKMLVKA